MRKETTSKYEVKPDHLSARILSVLFPAAYASVLLVFCIVYGIIPGPELLVLIFFIYAYYNKRSRRFVKDWFPFVSIFLCYEAMYAIVPTLAGTVHVQEPIAADLRLFGAVPTLVLQQFFRTPLFDALGAFFYSLHFLAPTAFGFLLWKFHPSNYGRYTLALAIGTYSALITYLLYPVAPPWYGVNAIRVLTQLDHDMGVPFYRSIFDLVQSNPFAAFPSLHAMLPWLISLFALKIGRKKALPILVFPIGVWLSTIYLGEHYVIDVIGGIVYGTVAFLVAEKLTPFLSHRQVSISSEVTVKVPSEIPLTAAPKNVSETGEHNVPE